MNNQIIHLFAFLLFFTLISSKLNATTTSEYIFQQGPNKPKNSSVQKKNKSLEERKTVMLAKAEKEVSRRKLKAIIEVSKSAIKSSQSKIEALNKSIELRIKNNTIDQDQIKTLNQNRDKIKVKIEELESLLKYATAQVIKGV